MNRSRLLGKQSAVNAARMNNTLNRARRCCEGSAQRLLRVGRKLGKRRDLNARTDDQITGDKTIRTGLDAKMSVENELLLRNDLGVRGNHLTRPSSAAPSEGAGGCLLQYFNHRKGGNKPARRRLQLLVRPLRHQ